MTGSRLAFVCTVVVGAAGLTAAGCGGSGGTKFFNDEGDVAIAAAMPSVIALGAGQMALAESLYRMDPSFSPVAPRPNVSHAGDTTSGGLTLDFGGTNTSGTTINGVRYRGELDATYVRSGSSATVNIDFTSLTAETDYLPFSGVGGTLTYSVTIGSGTATGSITGDVAVDSSTQLNDFEPQNLTFTLTNATDHMVHSGTSEVATTARGDWNLSFGNLGATLDPVSARSITSGSAAITRTTGSSLSVTLLFTGGSNSGTLTISPGSETRSFDLD
jgi:hypothetical protein